MGGAGGEPRGLTAESVTHQRQVWLWAFVDRFGLTPDAFDALTVERFQSGIAYIEKSNAAAQAAAQQQ